MRLGDVVYYVPPGVEPTADFPRLVVVGLVTHDEEEHAWVCLVPDPRASLPTLELVGDLRLASLRQVAQGQRELLPVTGRDACHLRVVPAHRGDVEHTQGEVTMPITTAGTAWFLTRTDITTEDGDRDARELARTLEMLPGVRGVTVHGGRSQAHARLVVHGTERGKRLALDVARVARVYEPDHDADHDHAACVASAHKMGVPEAYAHTPATYLSM